MALMGMTGRAMGKDYEVGYGKPPVHGQVKPGEVRNPLGGRAHNPELRKIKRLTTAEVEEMGDLILKGNRDGLKEILADPNSSVLKIWIASCAIKAMAKGDAHTLDILLNRFVGRVKERIELSGPNGAPVELSAETIEERRRRILEKVEKLKLLDQE